MAFSREVVGREGQSEANGGGVGAVVCRRGGSRAEGSAGAADEVAIAVTVRLGDDLGGCLMTDPEIPEHPAQNCASAAPAYDRDWRDALLVDAHEGADEDRDGGYMLDNDSRVCDQRPEIVRA